LRRVVWCRVYWGGVGGLVWCGVVWCGVGEVLQDFVGEGSDVVDPGCDFGAVPDGEFDGIAVPGEVVVPGGFGDVSFAVPFFGGLEIGAESIDR